MPVQHLLKQVELYRSRRSQRDVRPAWVSGFVDKAAELFDPASDVARVGFDCRLAEDCWEVGLYLGSIEMVGGKEDGMNCKTPFQFDLGRLLELFSEVSKFSWVARPKAEQSATDDPCSLVLIEGLVGEAPLRVTIFSTPPRQAGPGLRQYPNGQRETV